MSNFTYSSSNPMVALYCGVEVLEYSSSQLQTLWDAGYNTLVFWTMHINTDGALNLNSGAHAPLINSSGQYIGQPSWVSNAKAMSSIGFRVLFCIGSAAKTGNGDFGTIGSLLPTANVTISGNNVSVFNVPAAGENNILWQTFAGLYNAFSYKDSTGNSVYLIDGIVYDAEAYPSASVMITFSRMLYAIGYSSVQFCPAFNFNEAYWNDTLYYVEKGNTSPVKISLDVSGKGINSYTYTNKTTLKPESSLPGFVTECQLQCYNGGRGNTPKSWASTLATKMGWSTAQAESFIYPGYWTTMGKGNATDIICPTAGSDINYESVFTGFQTTGNYVYGGFIYTNNLITYQQGGSNCSESPTPANYAAALLKGLGLTNPN